MRRTPSRGVRLLFEITSRPQLDTKYVEARIASLRESGPFPPRAGIDPILVEQRPMMVSDLQLSLWPSLRASA